MTTDVAVRDKTMITSREKRTPDELVAEGRSQAEALMKVVRAAGLSKDLGGSKPHLEVEAWQTIMRFNGFLPTVVWAKAIVEGGAKVGYEARAELVDVNTGDHLIGAEAQCRFDEELERADGTTFQRWTDDYACESMAQTRAVSKLGRVGFAWVAVLGGYSGTPAEEMDGVKKRSRSVSFPFGEHKGQEPSALDVAALHKALPFWERQAADPNNKFAEANKRLVAAIKDAIAEKTAPVTTTEAPSVTVPIVPGVTVTMQTSTPPPENAGRDVAAAKWLAEIEGATTQVEKDAIWKRLKTPAVWKSFTEAQREAFIQENDRRQIELDEAKPA